MQQGPFSFLDVFWLVRLRWFAIAGLLITLFFSHQKDLIHEGATILAITMVLAGANFLLWLFLKAWLKTLRQMPVEWLISPQLLFDLIVLSLLIHYSGGVENPFVMFFAFHMAIGAMFLPPLQAWVIGMAGGGIHTTIVMGEYFDLLPHYHLSFAFHDTPHPDLHHMPAFVTGYVAAFFLMLAGVIYFVQTVAERSRQVELLRQEHERVAMSREKLARMGEIAAGVAHAIRNPLHGLINCAQILRKHSSPNDGTLAEMHDLMHEGLARIDRVTHRLLSLAREAPLHKVPTDLNQLVSEALGFVEGRVLEREIALQVKQDKFPPFLLDPDRFGEVLINLLDNAVDACPVGGTISVSTELNPERRNTVSVRIADSGMGIQQADLEKVFDPFFTTKAVGEGTGLGLAISRRVIEEHGGTIHLNSTSDLGTTIQINLPLASHSRI